MNKAINSLYEQHFGMQPASVEALSGSASSRQYFRLSTDGKSTIGVVGDNQRENHAFLALDASMRRAGIRVPEVLAVSDDEMCYLQEDLGVETLYDRIARCQRIGFWDDSTVTLLHEVMRDLPRIQFEGAKGFDFENLCTRERIFCATNIRWDLYYFKYCFLKCSGLLFDEIELEKDFEKMLHQLEAAWMGEGKEQLKGAFLYRDFQSRNVMISREKPYYIDFQGGFEGPFYYDVASFLWQARAAYPTELREELLTSYHEALQKYYAISREAFTQQLQHFVLFRLLQVLGAYGYRGLFERKVAFITPITQALQLAVGLFEQAGNEPLQDAYPYLYALLQQLQQLERFQPQPSKGGLTVRITSFSYKKGIPEDNSGNGGGFVFDCRAPHNPGRYAEYKKITGLQQPVIDFLEENAEGMKQYLGEERYQQIVADKLGTELTMPQYMEHVYGVVDPAVETYLTRGFTSLCVNFGCTGGQHRSVYGAQHLAEHLKALYPDLRIVLTHREQGIKQIL